MRDNRSLHVLAKQPDGAWRIVSAMFMDARRNETYASHSQRQRRRGGRRCRARIYHHLQSSRNDSAKEFATATSNRPTPARRSPDRRNAGPKLRLMLLIILLCGALMVAASLAYPATFSPVRGETVATVMFGVFFLLVGCGLFSAAFFGADSGHDDQVAPASREAGAR